MQFNYSDLIFIQPDSLSKEFCQEVIKKFEEDDRKSPGFTSEGLNTSVKLTTDLRISTLEDWKREDSMFNLSLSDAISKYINHLEKRLGRTMFYNEYHYYDTGYKIQKYFFDEYDKETGFYDWHTDFKIDSNGTRMLVFMWYLNTVEKGGETEFNNGLKIKPEAGSIVIFPSDWYIVHRGNKPLSGDKLICNGWIYVKLNK